MLQRARSSSSRSFMREAEFAKLILDNPYEEDYFKDLISEVVSNRKNPEKTYTGAKGLREQLLSCFLQKGEVKTANVWARLVPSNLTEVEFLLETIEERLRAEKDIFGAVELHLADREILSPHIQYVGTNAEKAEIIIAKTLVEFKYEVSITSAIGKKYEEYEKPYEASSGDLPIVKMDKFFEEQKEHREQTKEIQDILDEIDEMQNQFLNNFLTEAQTYMDETDKITQKMIKNIEEGISNYDYLKSQKIIDDSAKDLEAALAEIDDEIEKIIQRNREM